jgi:hypothetical protein
MIVVGVGECLGAIAAGFGEGGQFDGAMIGTGLTKIFLGLGMIGGRAAYKKGSNA